VSTNELKRSIIIGVGFILSLNYENNNRKR